MALSNIRQGLGNFSSTLITNSDVGKEIEKLSSTPTTDKEYLEKYDVDNGLISSGKDGYLNHDELIAFLTSAGIVDPTEQEALAEYLMLQTNSGTGKSISIDELLTVIGGEDDGKIDDFTLEKVFGADGTNSAEYTNAVALTELDPNSKEYKIAMAMVGADVTTTPPQLNELSIYYALENTPKMQDKKQFLNDLFATLGLKSPNGENYITGGDPAAIANDKYLTALTKMNSADIVKTLNNNTNVDAGVTMITGENAQLGLQGMAITATDEDFISLNNLNQGGLGDCWFLSGINAIIQTKAGQEMIDRAITKNADGSYSVTFPASPYETYTVTPDMLSQDTARSSGDTNMQVLEQAAKQYVIKHPDEIGTEGDIRGGRTKQVYGLFDLPVETLDGTDDNATKKNILKYAEDHPKGLHLTFFANAGGENGAIGSGEANHAYTITAIDPVTEMVTYENPWNMGEQHQISLDDLLATEGVEQFSATEFPESTSGTVNDTQQTADIKIGDGLMGVNGETTTRQELFDYLSVDGDNPVEKERKIRLILDALDIGDIDGVTQQQIIDMLKDKTPEHIANALSNDATAETIINKDMMILGIKEEAFGVNNVDTTRAELFDYLLVDGASRAEKARKIRLILETMDIGDLDGILDSGSEQGFTSYSRDKIIEILSKKSVYDIVDILNNGNLKDNPNDIVDKENMIKGMSNRLLIEKFKDVEDGKL